MSSDRHEARGPAGCSFHGCGGLRPYDVFATSGDGRGDWSPNQRVTDQSSTSDFIFNGDYFDVAPSFFGIWTDRRHQTSTGASMDAQGNIVIDEQALEDNVFGAPSATATTTRTGTGASARSGG